MPYPYPLRLAFALIIVTASLSWLALSHADDDDDDELVDLPEIKLSKARDLAALGAQARTPKRPIMLMFSMDGCEFCEVMEQNYLIPMLRSGDYQDKVIIRVIQVDDFRTLRDFDGSNIASRDLPDRYGVVVTPTLVFLNPQGKELVPSIVGIGTEGFFAGEIDDAIERALQRLSK